MIRIKLINEGKVVKQITSRLHEGVVMAQIEMYKDPFDTVQIVEGDLSEGAKDMLHHVAKKIIPAAMAAGVALGGAHNAQAQGGANPNYPGLNYSVGDHVRDIVSPNYKERLRQREHQRSTERQVWDAEQNEIRRQRVQAARDAARAHSEQNKVYDQARNSGDGKFIIIYGMDDRVTRIPAKGTEFMPADSQRMAHYITPNGNVYYVRHPHTAGIASSISRESVAEGAFDNASPMAKDSIKKDRIQSLKNLIASYKEKGNMDKVKELKRELQSVMNEGYTVTRGIDRERYTERPGLEGPYATKSGKVVYYDKVEGKYYDPDTDMYIDYDDWHAMNEGGTIGTVGTIPASGTSSAPSSNMQKKTQFTPTGKTTDVEINDKGELQLADPNALDPQTKQKLAKAGLPVAEDAVDDFLAKGGKIEYGKTHKPRKGEMWQGSSHIGSVGGKGSKGRVSGMSANTNPKSNKPVVNASQYSNEESPVTEGNYDRSVDIGQQMANDGITYSPERENEIIGQMAEYMKRSGFSSKEIRYLMNYDEDYIPDQLSYLPKEQGVAEGSEERGQNRLWQMITDYEQRAKATKNDIKKAHYMKMASELRGKLKTSDEQGVAEQWPDYDDNQYSLTDSTGKELTLLRGNTPEEAIERAKQLIGSNEKLLATFGLVKLTPRPHYIVRNAKRQGVAEGPGFDKWADDRAASQLHKLKKPHPETWHDVDKKLGKAVDKMSQAEKVKKGLAHPATLKKQGVAEGSKPNNIGLLIQKLEDMSELIYQMVPGSKKDRLIDKRDELEARIEAMPGGKAALLKWAREYNDSFDEGVAEGTIGDKIKGAAKSVKRATQGWGVGGAPDMVTPAGAVKAFKDMDGQRLANFVATRKHLSKPRKGSASEFANKVIDREMKQRGYGRVVGKDEQGVAEGYNDDSPVANAITRRIMMQRADLLQKYGPEKVGQAIDDVAEWVGDVEEIGSSDVSAWVKDVERALGTLGHVVEAEQGLDAILDQYSADWAKFKAGGDIDENPDFYDALFGYFASNGEMPYGTQKARTGDPIEWLTTRLDQEAGNDEVVESQLNEYLLMKGEPITSVLGLNLFQDLVELDNLSAEDENFANNSQWQQIEKKYAPIANKLRLALHKKGGVLTAAEAAALEDTWYDGSDAYDDMELNFLSNVYDKQIDMIEALLAGNITDEEFGESVDDEDPEAATAADQASADKNIIMQIRRAADYEKPTQLQLGDGARATIDARTAKAMLAQFDKLRPDSKMMMQQALNTHTGFEELSKHFGGGVRKEAITRVGKIMSAAFKESRKGTL